MNLRKDFFRLIRFVIVLGALPFLTTIALISRFKKKKIDVGLGPEPLINNVYHKKALEHFGYSAETFVAEVYFITDQFDVRADKILFDGTKSRVLKFLTFANYLYLFVLSVWRYKSIYIYLNGGPLGLLARDFALIQTIEPLLYKLAGVKVVVMPYGGDVQDLARCPNLIFRHFMTQSYPSYRFSRPMVIRQIDVWTKYADHIISGCDWVDYMYHWDTLTLAHFSIDTERWKPSSAPDLESGRPLKILHAPNHRAIKGTDFFIRAVDELKAEGVSVELVLAERVPNDKIRELVSSVDVVADQLIIGWYAMFALEGMSMEKTVLCYLRSDLENLYIHAGLIQPGEVPVVNCTPLTVKDVIRDLAQNRDRLPEIGRRSREFVLKHHSTESIGRVFDGINRSLGIMPSRMGK